MLRGSPGAVFEAMAATVSCPGDFAGDRGGERVKITAITITPTSSATGQRTFIRMPSRVLAERFDFIVRQQSRIPSRNPAPFGGCTKKTGLVGQGVTEKPGEFSNLVLSGIAELIGPALYRNQDRNRKTQKNSKNRSHCVHWVLLKIKPSGWPSVKGLSPSIKPDSY
jgi:hypothetical protein